MKRIAFGIVTLLAGFTIPFLLAKIVPYFMYSSFLSIVLFWAAFLLILHPIDKNSLYNHSLQYARYAVFINMGLSIFLGGYCYLLFHFEIYNSISVSVMNILDLISNPIRYIFELIVAKPTSQGENGTILVTTSFLRTLLTDFFNLVLYCSIGLFSKSVYRIYR